MIKDLSIVTSAGCNVWLRVIQSTYDLPEYLRLRDMRPRDLVENQLELEIKRRFCEIERDKVIVLILLI